MKSVFPYTGKHNTNKKRDNQYFIRSKTTPAKVNGGGIVAKRRQVLQHQFDPKRQKPSQINYFFSLWSCAVAKL
jgi:hypothetical protein